MSDGEVSKRQNPASSRSGEMGTLHGCLVEGDVEQLARMKRARRRALAISLLMQAAAVAAVLVVPLIWATERMALATQPPMPIYARGGALHHSASSRPARPPGHFEPCVFCPPHSIPGHIVTSDPLSSGPDDNLPDLPEGNCPGCPNITGAIQSPITSRTAPPPRPLETKAPTPPRIRVATIEPAMLLYRVEPVYPYLAKVTRRSGRVELHAIIATDGTIRSLQAVSGDPVFFQSALDAVRQWRYRPTILNGQAVEVETTITVIYQMQ